MRERGRRGGRGGHVPQAFFRPSPGQKFVVTHTVFDLFKSSGVFQRSAAESDENALTQALLKRNQELTPSAQEQGAILNLVTKITDMIDILIVSPDAVELGIEEVRPVGSYKKGTMLSGHPVADVTVILKKLPTAEQITLVAERILKGLKEPTGVPGVSLQINDGGFNLTASGVLVRVLITTLPKNLREAVADKHVDVKLLEGALATIRHSRWFEENAFHTTVRILVRILKDMKKRFSASGFQGLTPWLIDLLAHRATISASMEPLTINVAFRRALQLLASGLFLPGSVGIIDPCESANVRSHSVLSLEEQDAITTCAQTLVRCLSHGAVNEVLGLVSAGVPSVAVDSEVTSWGGVIVTPGVKAYEKTEEKPAEETEVMDSEEASSDTQTAEPEEKMEAATS